MVPQVHFPLWVLCIVHKFRHWKGFLCRVVLWVVSVSWMFFSSLVLLTCSKSVLRLHWQRFPAPNILSVLFSAIASTFISVNKQSGPPLLIQCAEVDCYSSTPCCLRLIDRITFFFQIVEMEYNLILFFSNLEWTAVTGKWQRLPWTLYWQ